MTPGLPLTSGWELVMLAIQQLPSEPECPLLTSDQWPVLAITGAKMCECSTQDPSRRDGLLPSLASCFGPNGVPIDAWILEMGIFC